MLPILILFASSLVSIFLIALLIKWLHPNPERAVTKQEFQDQLHSVGITGEIENMLVSITGQEAIASLTNDGQIAVSRKLGDRFSVRTLTPSQIEQDGSKILIHDFTWPAFSVPTDQSANLEQILSHSEGETHAR